MKAVMPVMCTGRDAHDYRLAYGLSAHGQPSGGCEKCRFLRLLLFIFEASNLELDLDIPLLGCFPPNSCRSSANRTGE